MEDKETESKTPEQDTEKVDETETVSEADASQGSDLQSIKDAYEAKLKRVEEEAEKAKKQYETDLATRNKMIADLIGNETSVPVSSPFEKIIKARENNKRY